MKNLLLELRAWLNGWRYDLDGWLVRARRAADPDLNNRPDLGFVEDACVAVRDAKIARDIDKGLLQRAENFIAGFEDDEMQEGVNDLLADIRKAIAT